MDKKKDKPPKPLKILVNLFAKSKHAKNDDGAKAAAAAAAVSPNNNKEQNEGGRETQYSPPIVVHPEDSRSSCVMLFPPSDAVSMAPSVATRANAQAVGATELYTELEALHLSRQDNPFVQKHISASQDNLDEQSMTGSFMRCGSQSVMSGSHSLMSPEPTYSPTRSCDPLVLGEVHNHLIRSPPPVNWPERAFPLSPRSTNGTFSPDSSDGLEMDAGGAAHHMNYYTRSQSEEHILSPCRDLLRSGIQVGRGATPELLMTTSLHVDTSAVTNSQYQQQQQQQQQQPSSPSNFFPPASPRPLMHQMSTPSRPGSQLTNQPASGRQKVRRNQTLNLSCSGDVLGSSATDFYGGGGGGEAISGGRGGGKVDRGSLSPFRNQISYDCGAISVSSYAMNQQPPTSSTTAASNQPAGFAGHRRSVGARPGGGGGNSLNPVSKKLSAPASAGPSSGEASTAGGGFFSSWRSSYSGGGGGGRQRRRTSESQAQSPPTHQDAKSMENLIVDQGNLRLLGASPSGRKSICSMSGGGGLGQMPHSPRNNATLFTRWKVKDPDPLHIY